MKFNFFIGIDMANQDFTVAVYRQSLKEKPLILEKIPNDSKGFQKFLDLLNDNEVSKEEAIFCMEHCGVYGDKLCHYLCESSCSLALEDPTKIRRAFRQLQPKTDVMDAIRIAQYSYRFTDELVLWEPKTSLIEEAQSLLAYREQLVKQSTGLKNFVKGQKKKHHVPDEVVQSTLELLEKIQLAQKEMEMRLKALLKTKAETNQKVHLLCSIPGVSTLLASHIMIHTNEFTKPLIPKHFSSYLGMCPNAYESGTSVRKKTRTRQFGPSLMRKLFHLAALSIRTHRREFREYFMRKVMEGKPKMVILNNIKNKIIKLMAAILRENKPYRDNYVSISPKIMQEALTKS